MISSSDFREQWHDEDDPLVAFPSASTADLQIPSEVKEFLNTVGLPTSASPFLDFRVPECGPLETAAKQWQLSSDFDRYRVIGSNGSGDPICLDEKIAGSIVYLNHDNSFERVFINSSVQQLAESLLLYSRLVRETQERNGEDAFLDNNIPQYLKQWLRKEFERVDSPAVCERCFWTAELANLEDNIS